MTNKLLAAAALCCAMMAFNACTNDDNPVVKNDGISTNTIALYDDLGITELMTDELAHGNYVITETVLIYDQAGQLALKLDRESTTLSPLTIENTGLADGDYTIVALQTARTKDGETAWDLNDADKLSTVNITSKDTPLDFASAIGCATANATIKDGIVNASLTPRPLGSIVEVTVDNLTADKGYAEVSLSGAHSQYNHGCYLNPALADDERWIKMETPNTYDFICYLNPENPTGKFFTLSHGDAVRLYLDGYYEEGGSFMLVYDKVKLNVGDYAVYYFDLDRDTWQPPFFGNYADFTAWKADRDAGILAVDPCLDWGCNIDKVQQHVQAKQWWFDGNDKLELWEGLGWHKWYYVANYLTEQYLFATEDGQDLCRVLSICHDSTVPVEVPIISLQKQGYTLLGSENNTHYFMSPDEKTRARVNLWGDGRWEIEYYANDIE